LKLGFAGSVVAVLLVLAVPRLVAQEGAPADEDITTEDTNTGETDVPSVEEDVVEEAPPPEPRGSALQREVLPMDIKTSSFTDLALWCTRLGLSAQGDRSTLERRLYEYYGVQPPQTIADESSEITIERSQRTEYFSLEEFKEDYVRLDGGVFMKMTDKKKGHTYTIKADSILYNQTLKLLSANGHVEYSISGGGRDESFTGESLTMNIDTWEGYFFDGTTFRDRTVEEADLTFRIQGEFVSRSSSDFVIMENATITSSPRIPANYRIEADKIWILDKGEFGLSGATLNVGHIPVFYFPFFFYPGDEVIFHPVFGQRTREGTFMQTTTYFIGNRKNTAFPFAFLNVADEGDNDKIKETRGIFLHDTEEALGTGENTYLKAMFDVYSNLGTYVGLGGDISGMFPGLNTLSFNLGIGGSRNLYSQENSSTTIPGYAGSYTPHFQNTDGSLETHWHRSMLGTMEVPWRYGASVKLAFSLDRLNVNLLMELYSDPYLEEDFFNRAEQMDWSKIFDGFTDKEETETVPLKDRLSWQLDGRYSPDVSFLSPYLSNFSLSRFLVSMDWRNKETPSGSLPLFARNVDPTRRFYYPDSVTVPELSFQIGGTLFSSDDNKPESPAAAGGTADASTSEEGAPALVRPPWEDEEQAAESDTQSEDPLRLPDLRKDIAVSLFPTPFGYTIGYSLNPRITYQMRTNSRDWNMAEDVRYDFAYSTASLQNALQLSYSFRFYETLLQVSGNTSLATQYQNVDIYDDELSQTEKDNLILQAYRYSSLNLTNGVDFTTYPFAQTDLFKSTNFRYNIGTLLYRKTFDPAGTIADPQYRDEYFKPTQEYITANSLNMDASVETLPFTPRVQLSYVLPPLDKSFAATSILTTGPLISTAVFQTRQVEDKWVNQPFSIDEQLKIADRVSLRATYLYDYEEDTHYSLVSNLQLFFLTASYELRYTQPYTFNGPATGWIIEPEKEFIPSKAGLGINYNFESEPLWKNRIKFGLGITSSWNVDLIRFTESALSFGYTLTFSVYRMIDIKFSAQSSNNMTYTYIPSYADKVGIERRDPVKDLIKSFNFFKTDDRYESYFKLSSISLEFVHHLDDWDLSFTYTGKPEMLTMPDGSRQFTWESLLGIYLRWVPIPQIKREFEY
jgi:lipopolysaccharide assembly outer membrane protein LptD (OstA)